MTIKNFHVDHNLGYGTISDVHGGVQLQIIAKPELNSLLAWWQEWRPVFESKNPSVMDTLNQAKVLHGISQE